MSKKVVESSTRSLSESSVQTIKIGKPAVTNHPKREEADRQSTRLGRKSVKTRAKKADRKVPDRELWDLIRAHQDGDESAAWSFVQHKKIQAIISGRMRDYRRMFHWLPAEDFDDVECSLQVRIVELLGKFELPEQPNDGRVLSYFTLRSKGEGDFIIRKITGMRQVVDEEQGKSYLKSYSQPMDGLEEVLPNEDVVDTEVIGRLEDERQDSLLEKILQGLPEWSNDRIWVRCYILRLKGHKWSDIAKAIGYRQTDYTWLKENTARFVTRLKHKLILMGETVNYRICGIYTDSGIVAIALHDSQDKKNDFVWSKTYETYADLDRVEAKLGDLFRQFDVSYVTLNEERDLSMARAIVMRYLSRRESFVEEVDLQLFRSCQPRMPDIVGDTACTDDHKSALLLAHVKRAHLEETAIIAQNS